MINVLFVVDSLKQRFGVTSVVMNYYRNINKADVHIDFLCLPDSELEIVNEIKDSKGRVFFMPKLGAFNLFAFRKFMKNFFNDNSYDIVHSHFNQIDSIVFPIAKSKGVRHCVSHSHNTKYSDYFFRSIRNWFLCIPLRYVADTWAACSFLAGEFLYGKSYRNSPKKLLINNAISCEKFAYNVKTRNIVRDQLKMSNEILIGNVGSLKIQKNQIFLLKLFSFLVSYDKMHNYKLLIVGDGPLKESLKNKAEELGVEKSVIWAGQRKDVNSLLQAIDIFILPSLYEGLPVIGIEAQASGLPCVFSDSITKEVDICNVSFLSLDANIEEWAETVKNLVGFKRIDVSETIKNKGFDIRKECDKLSNIYKKMIM